MMYKKSALVLLLMLLCRVAAIAQGVQVVSPNKKIQLTLLQNETTPGMWFFRIGYADNDEYKVVISAIKLGISGKGALFNNGLKFNGAGKSIKITDSYLAPHGKRSERVNRANEVTLSFTNANKQKINVVARLYNDGVAFKYVMPGKKGDVVLMTDEATSYEILPQSERWLQKFVTSYEGFYPKQNGVEKGQWGYPALFSTNMGKVDCWYLITEAGIDSTYCATKIENTEAVGTYKLQYPAQTDGNGAGSVNPTVKLPWQSPWRVIIMGNLATLAQSTLVEDVSAPSVIKNTEWIKPGVSSWIYWAYNHGTMDYRKVTEYIDLAARMNWPYTLFDWEWDAMGNGGNLEDAVKYATAKGIKPMMWYNSGGPNGVSSTPKNRLLTHQSRVKEFAWLKKIGVYGVKVDFFESDKQDMIKYYIGILQDAADAGLMVNLHGSTVPRGWSRTYPNLMSMEAVLGAEQYNNGPLLTTEAAAHNTTLPFTRNVIGPMDYTPVTFTNSQHPHITSYAHELALSVVFESSIQHFADRPSGFDELPDAPKAFLKCVPASWDDTRFIDGYPGKRVILARRKADKWYLAGINGTKNNEKVKVSLNFLPAGKSYKVTLIGDGEHDRAFNTTYTKLNSESVLEVNWLPRGGFVATFQEI